MDDSDRKQDAPGCGSPPPGKKLKGPFVTKCEAGKLAWCRCEKSARYPMCDGTHRGSDVSPVKVVLEEARVCVFCACGLTKNAPWCDGSHMRLC